LAKVQKKYTSITTSLTRKTGKYLQKMRRQERKLQRKAAKSGSGYLHQTNIDSTYTAFSNELSAKSSRLSAGGQSVANGQIHLDQYNPFIDTLSTSLSFLQKYKGLEDKIKLPTDALNKLKNKLNETQKVKEFIASRKQFIKDQLSKFSHLPNSLKKQYAGILYAVGIRWSISSAFVLSLYLMKQRSDLKAS
jgi:chromosome segregation ATPase